MEQWLTRTIQRCPLRVCLHPYRFRDIEWLSRTVLLPQRDRVVISESNSIMLLAKLLAVYRQKSVPVLVSPNYAPRIKYECIRLAQETASFPNEAMIVFTTGTSSPIPKGVALSHDNLLSHIDMLRRHIPEDLFGKTDRTVALLPWTHCYGLLGECFSALDRMATMTTIRHPVTLPYVMQSFKPTILFVVPKMLEKILWLDRRLRPYCSSARARRALWFGPSIRYLVSGGVALPGWMFHEFQSHLGLHIFQGYGCSEMSPMISLQTHQETDGTNAGTLLPDVSIRFTGDNQDEIAINGPNRFIGYIGQEAIPVANFHATGDTGFLDEHHRLHITGRVSGIVKLSNGKFANMSMLEQEIHAMIRRPVCLWDLDGRIHGTIVKPTLPEWERLLKNYKWIVWHQRDRDFALADGTMTIKGEANRRVLRDDHKRAAINNTES